MVVVAVGAEGFTPDIVPEVLPEPVVPEPVVPDVPAALVSELVLPVDEPEPVVPPAPIVLVLPVLPVVLPLVLVSVLAVPLVEGVVALVLGIVVLLLVDVLGVVAASSRLPQALRETAATRASAKVADRDLFMGEAPKWLWVKQEGRLPPPLKPL